MDLLNSYFQDIVFRRIEDKQGYAIYGAAISSMIAGDNQRHVFAFVPMHLGVQSTARLSELPWQNLQMRMCPKMTYRLREQHWVLNPTLQDHMFGVVARSREYSTYSLQASAQSDFPFELLMINVPSKKSMYQYPNTLSLHAAIDKFNTIFNYTGTVQPIQLTELPRGGSQHKDFDLI